MTLPFELLIEKVHHAFRLWRSDRLQESPLDGLLVIEQRLRNGTSVALATHDVLTEALATLQTNSPDPASLLRERFFDGTTMEQLSRQRPWSVATLYAQQRDAIVEVARILERQEQTLRQTRLDLLHRDFVPESTTPLIGVTPKLATLIHVVTTQQAPWLISLTGEGGIGKTSIAEALVRELVVHGTIDKTVWVSAKQEMLSVGGRIIPLTHSPLLTPDTLIATLAEKVVEQPLATWKVPEYEQIETIQAKLRQAPHLLVLDNLETIPNLTLLVPLLRRLASPSKILLTSRVHLPDEGDIFAYPVPPLTEQEAHQLLLQEAQIRNIPVLAACDIPTANRIYAVVGGNPLALRLVAGQVGLYGLDRVLSDLRHATDTGEPLYRFLYEWTWHQLPEVCRKVILAMVIGSQEGSDLDGLTMITSLPVTEVKAAVALLVAQNLLHVQTNLIPPTYVMHNLTRTFLQEAVLKW